MSKQKRSTGGKSQAASEPEVTPVTEEAESMDLLAYASELQPDHGEEEAEALEAERAWISFRVADQLCALKVEDIQEVLRVSTITRVPQAPRAVRGVTNMRGRVLPVVDLRVRLGLADSAQVDDHSRLLVAIFRGRLIGLLADSVEKMVLIRASSVQEAPRGVIRGDERAIVGVSRLDQRLLLLLDVQAVLDLGAAAAA